jgi:hypothetical protein
MGEPLTLLVLDREHDIDAAAAIEQLAHLAGLGLLRELWAIDVADITEDPLPGELISEYGRTTVPLIRSIASAGQPVVTRIVTMASAGLADDHVGALLSAARHVTLTLRRVQPPGVPCRDCRVVFPDSLDEVSALSRIFEPGADNNVVVIPEDRAADTSFAAPVAPSEPEAFAAHIAVEVATQAGLWRAMENAPLDAGRPGAVDGIDPKVVLARSYARITVSALVPLHDAMATEGMLPLPTGAEATPAPITTALHVADGLFESSPELHYHAPADFRVDQEALSLRATICRYGKEAGAYLGGLPRQLAGALGADLTETAGEALTAAVGQEASIEVVWAGKAPSEGEERSHPDVEVIKRGLRSRLVAVEAPVIDQQQWSRLVSEVAAAVDASPSAKAPLLVNGLRLVVLEPSAISPDPAPGLAATVSALSSETLHPERGTLLGRLGGLIGLQQQQARTDFDTRVTELDRYGSGGFNQRRSLGILTWPMGVLAAFLITLVTIALRVAPALGSDSWDDSSRTTLGIIVAVICLLPAGFALVAGTRGGSTVSRQLPWWAAGFVLVGTISAGAGSTKLDFAGEEALSVPIKELLMTGGVCAAILVALVATASQGTNRGRAATRLLGLIGLIYVSIMSIALIGKPEGWQSLHDPATVRADFLRVSGWVAAAMLVGLLVITMVRVRERLALANELARFHWVVAAARASASEVVRLRALRRQYLGTAAALARLTWYPFGQAQPGASDPSADLAEFPALKLRILPYQLSERGRMGTLARIRQIVAEPGWIHRQYATAADAFIPELAFRTGRDPDEVAGLRPETDPSIEAADTEQVQTNPGPRWRFAELLYDGRFDLDLSTVGVERILSDALDRYLEPVADTTWTGSNQPSMSEFGAELLSGERPTLPASFFHRIGLLTANDQRARFRSAVWWPRAIESPASLPASTVQHHGSIDATNPTQLVVQFIRSDWSDEFPLSLTPLAPQPPRALREVQRADSGQFVM